MEKYHLQTIRTIKIIYIISAIIWIILFFWLKTYFDGLMTWFFFLIPLFVFSINFVSLQGIDRSLDTQMCRGNCLAICLLAVDIVINWNKSLNYSQTIIYFRILLIAFIFIVLSLMDIWLPIEQLSIVKHIKTILQTMALTLLSFALYIYYENYNSTNIF